MDKRGDARRAVNPIIAVAVDAPLRQLFDYRPPPGCAADQLLPGVRLWVPFGRRRVVGLLVETRQESQLPQSRLKTALALIDDAPVVDPSLLSLLRWASDYYRHPIGEVIAAALPATLRHGAEALEQSDAWQLSEQARQGGMPDLPARASRLREVVGFLQGREWADAGALNELAPRWREHLRELEKRGWVTRIRVEPGTDRAPGGGEGQGSSGLEPAPQPTPEQQLAIEAIDEASGKFAPFLLHGITGSGKTEVYLRTIERVAARGGQSLVLVPEIALTPQLVARFEARFGSPIVVLHSSLADQERLRAWRQARSGNAPVVIGTRSAIFAPLARPALIVVDEEHDPSYKQQEGFRYSARDLALVRAQQACVPIVLGSATPSLESLEQVRAGRASLLELPNRTAGARPPTLRLVDLRRHAANQGLATPTVLAVHRHLDAGGQVLLYLNRRGYAPTLFCPSCGWIAPCPRCDARLTVHQREGRLHCHHCGTQHPIPGTCPSCGDAAKPVGQGTQRIEETLETLFPGVPLARIDRDAVRRRGSLQETLEQIASGAVRLIVGTQMLTKGHHFPDVSLVVVLNADQGLFGTDFRASERLAQTIVQVAGRAGRAERPGEVLIQTEYPEHPLLQRLINGGYEAFASAALSERKAAAWPPYARVAVLRAEAAGQSAPLAFLDRARELAEELRPAAVELLGPAAAPMERRAGQFRAQLLLHAPTHSPLQRLFGRWLPAIEQLPEARKVRWSLDVDPLELF